MRTKWAAFLIFCAYVMALAALTAPARAEPDEVTLPAVMYHHIDADAASSGAYVITPETFESDLRWLRVHGYESVSVRELLDWEAGKGSLPEKPVLLTFDDGQESFHAWALPLLEKYGMCAVAAVVGSYADEYTANGDTNVKYACMSWDTIAEAAATGRVEIASHTQAMHEADGERRGCRINPGENPADYAAALNADLAEVEASIISATGRAPAAFAYPFGFTCAEAEAVLTERGYAAAFTCEERLNTLTRAPGELMRIGRFNRASGADSGRFFASMGLA